MVVSIRTGVPAAFRLNQFPALFKGNCCRGFWLGAMAPAQHTGCTGTGILTRCSCWLSASELQVAVRPLVVLFDQQRLAVAYEQTGHLGHPVCGVEGTSFHQEPAGRLPEALISFLPHMEKEWHLVGLRNTEPTSARIELEDKRGPQKLKQPLKPRAASMFGHQIKLWVQVKNPRRPSGNWNYPSGNWTLPSSLL